MYKRINAKEYSQAKRHSSVTCTDYEELEDCNCSALSTKSHQQMIDNEVLTEERDLLKHRVEELEEEKTILITECKINHKKLIDRLRKALEKIASTMVFTPVNPTDKQIIRAYKKVICKHYDVAQKALKEVAK